MNIQLANQSIAINIPNSQPVKGGYIAAGSHLKLNLPVIPIRYLYSGWQSWSLTSWVEVSRPVRQMRPVILNPMQTDPVYAHESRPNGSWYGAVQLPNKKIILIGALGIESHVLLDGQIMTGWYESGEGEWFIASGDEEDIFSRYAELLGERLGKGRGTIPDRVWCSWYSFYTQIHENQMFRVLDDLGDLPFDVFQIDDGWQIAVGVWEPNDKFPSGMDSMAARIKNTGRKAGLWLAPLLVVPSTNIFREHQDWLLHDEKGHLVSAGYNWGSQLYTIDTTHPGALEWLAKLMVKVRRWGYDYVKLDFLYAGALPGKHFIEMPRETAYRKSLEVIREALGDAYFLTCGAPVLPSIGLCDALRIGPDVAEYWSSHRDENLLMNYATPGLRNALRTTLHRLWLSPLVHTDPDVVFFRTRLNHLTQTQKSLQQDMAEICDFKAASDPPELLTAAERKELHDYLLRKSSIQKVDQTSFIIGSRKVSFAPYVGMPSLPNMIQNVQGALINLLAYLQPLVKLYEQTARAIQVKRIKKHSS